MCYYCKREEHCSIVAFLSMQKILKMISLQKEQGRLSHAYLIMGTFDAKEITDFLKIKIADQFVIENSPIKISDIRELAHFLQLRPHSSQNKLAVIHKIDNMTLEAGNAILKILEEPPESSILILQAEKKEKILPTIISRCQILKNLSYENGTCEEYLSPEIISKKTLKERFDYALKIAESPELAKILNLWEKYYREKMLKGQDVRTSLNRLFTVKDLLSTNTSVKLLLENLLLNFD